MRPCRVVCGNSVDAQALRLHLAERGFVGPGIYLKQQLALTNEIAVFEMDLEEFPGHLSFDRNGVGSDIADSSELPRHSSLGDLRDHDGNSYHPRWRRSLLVRAARHHD